jgi:hypothetical protein
VHTDEKIDVAILADILKNHPGDFEQFENEALDYANRESPGGGGSVGGLFAAATRAGAPASRRSPRANTKSPWP